jgi:hypothetical protein
LIRAVCTVAGSLSFLDEIDEEIRHAGLDQAVASGKTPPIFDWLVTAFSFQGISDRVARSYMEKHGTTSWSKMEASLEASPTCQKLQTFWDYAGCRYDKGSFTCAEPDHIDACPVPRPRLRNGRLNQTAYSLFLFVRDIAGDDLVGWIDSQLKASRSALAAISSADTLTLPKPKMSDAKAEATSVTNDFASFRIPQNGSKREAARWHPPHIWKIGCKHLLQPQQLKLQAVRIFAPVPR